jgi:hypothetical protein
MKSCNILDWWKMSKYGIVDHHEMLNENVERAVVLHLLFFLFLYLLLAGDELCFFFFFFIVVMALGVD